VSDVNRTARNYLAEFDNLVNDIVEERRSRREPVTEHCQGKLLFSTRGIDVVSRVYQMLEIWAEERKLTWQCREMTAYRLLCEAVARDEAGAPTAERLQACVAIMRDTAAWLHQKIGLDHQGWMHKFNPEAHDHKALVYVMAEICQRIGVNVIIEAYVNWCADQICARTLLTPGGVFDDYAEGRGPRFAQAVLEGLQSAVAANPLDDGASMRLNDYANERHIREGRDFDRSMAFVRAACVRSGDEMLQPTDQRYVLLAMILLRLGFKLRDATHVG